MNEKQQQEYADLLEDWNKWMDSFLDRKDQDLSEYMAQFLIILRKLVGNVDDRLMNIERRLS